MIKLEGHRPLTEIIDSLLIKHSDSIDAIDEAYLNKIAYDYLKTLGNNVCLIKYAYVHVKDNVGYLDSDFRSCKLALLVEPKEYHCTQSVEILRRTRIYNDYIDRYGLYLKSEEDAKFCDFKEVITEEIPITIYYSNPRRLKVVDKKIHDGQDIKSIFPISNHSIQIYNNEVNASFKDGVIAMEYYSLPMDEDGVPLVPETRNNYVVNYLSKLLEVSIMEMPSFMKTNPDYIKLFYSTFKQELRVLKANALTEVERFTMKDIMEVFRNNNASYNNHRNQIPL